MRSTNMPMSRRMTGSNASSFANRDWSSSLGMAISVVGISALAEAIRGFVSISAISPITLPFPTLAMTTSLLPALREIST
ncbi:MAG: hypothetical protein VW802_03970 [Rhodospirillaceae bacterium]|jgi:hypothetical protein